MASSRLSPAVVGAAVTLLTSFAPFSPVLGGGAASWLSKSTEREGAYVGALSGLLASLVFAPLLLFGLAIAVFDGGFTFLLMVAVTLVGALYFVLFSALGGHLGALVREDRNDGRVDDPQRALERLRYRYAEGDCSHAEFERRLARLGANGGDRSWADEVQYERN